MMAGRCERAPDDPTSRATIARCHDRTRTHATVHGEGPSGQGCFKSCLAVVPPLLDLAVLPPPRLLQVVEHRMEQRSSRLPPGVAPPPVVAVVAAAPGGGGGEVAARPLLSCSGCGRKRARWVGDRARTGSPAPPPIHCSSCNAIIIYHHRCFLTGRRASPRARRARALPSADAKTASTPAWPSP
eukprot:SAG31_NODE_18100_length_647_cov_0.569343_1_plen_184_part_01